MNRIFFLACSVLIAPLCAENQPLWLRYPSISPDGKNVVFAYKGDLFLVSSSGGSAKQLTTHPAYDSYPIWSPNSQQIAFSSARNGAMDIYTLPISGGTPTRLTYFTGFAVPNAYTPDGKHILYNENITPAQNYGEFPKWGQVYSVPVEGGRSKQFMSFPAYNVDFNQSGDQIIYHDMKGYENEWRKDHTSSVCRDIWHHNLKTGKFTNLSKKQVEDRQPVFSPDENKLYFLSERFGDFNICEMNLAQPEQIKQITHFENHPVRFLTSSDEGRLCFSFDGEIYTMRPNEAPQKLNISIIADDTEATAIERTHRSGASEIAVSPSGKEFAFILRGDVFVANAQFGTSKRITNTAALERDVHFSPDGRSLVYSSHRSGQWNLYTTRIKNKLEKSFAYANELVEEALVVGASACFQAQYSPTGKEIAFLRNRTEIVVIDVASKRSRVVLPAHFNYSYSDGDQSFEWSPNGEWILAKFFEQGGWQHTDIALVKADGSGEKYNLTSSGYADANPRWVMNGKAIIWSSDRQGMRSHGSWGAQRDVYALFLTDESYREFNMSKEERALYQLERNESPPQEKKSAPAAEAITPLANAIIGMMRKAKPKTATEAVPKVKPAKKAPVGLDIDLDGFEERTMRLTIHSSQLGDAILTRDGKKLYYLAAFEKGFNLWVHNFEDKSTRMLSKVETDGSLELSSDGRTLYLLTRDRIMTIDPNNGSTRPLSYVAEFEHKPKAERAGLFYYVWQQINDRFYDKEFKNIDWAYFKKSYERFLPHINNNYDFSDLLSEMLGELNTSHTGAMFRERATRAATASLGAFYDESYEKDGLKIAEIIERGPLSEARRIKAGMIIKAIDNNTIKAGKDYFALLQGKANKRVRLHIYDPEKKESFNTYVKPIAHGAQNALLYKRWVEQRKEMVEKLSDGQLGYIHVAQMNSPSFRKAYSEVLGRYRNSKAIVIDTRFNGGGWLHEDLAHLFNGKEYAQFVPRGQYIGSDPITQWTKPSIVIMSEGNYSNAHGFPWLYKELNIGKLVGAPVPGTMTAVWWDRMMNGVTFGLPQVGMIDRQGRYLENLQLEPDIEVYNHPSDALQGKDAQLEAAVQSLLQNLAEDKTEPFSAMRR